MSDIQRYKGNHKLEANRLGEIFRHSYGPILASLLRTFGHHHLDIIEDATQLAMQRAIEKWALSGAPDDHAGWLHTVARNAVYDALRKQRREVQLDEHVNQFQADMIDPGPNQNSFESQADDMLSMILLCCNPDLSKKSQLCLTLRTACSLSVTEIARSLSTEEEAVKRMISRAKEICSSQQEIFSELHADRIRTRFSAVMDTIYVLFTEGYSASNGTAAIRTELAFSAIRLVEYALASHLTPRSELGSLHALRALMLLNFARFDARLDERQSLVRLGEQNRLQWDKSLINAGLVALSQSQMSDRVTSYHLEARIAAAHVMSPSLAETDWQKILMLYDHLITVKDTELVRLNRIVALRFATNADIALRELEDRWKDSNPVWQSMILGSYLFYSVRADLCEAVGLHKRAKQDWLDALSAAPTTADQRLVEDRLRMLNQCCPEV